jgi:hypothetical protein
MTTDGAGGLSTANLRAVLDALDDDEPSGLWQFEAAARAELAALVEAAGRATTLAAALTEARGYLGSLDGRELVGAGRALRLDARALLRRLDAALADAGPGAAGARDAPTSFAAFVAWLGREGLSLCAWEEFDAERRAAEQVPGEWRPLEATAVLARRQAAVRAGRAGETEAVDGGAGGG